MAKIRYCSLIVVLFVLVGAVRADDSDVNLTTAPPVVVKAVPEAGSDGVNPGLTEIKVTYSKDMMDGSWSWSTAGKDNFPETTGKPHYMKDKRTCVLSVHLKPGKTYAIWLNSENFGNFKDADGNSAVPYLLVFKTKP
jgi:Bacterial Ig-like domain